jgi:hypothetical protein
MKLPFVLVFSSIASAALGQTVCPPSSATHRSIDSPKVAQELGELAKYFDHYPCDKINGKTIYDLMRPLFLFVAGKKQWRRILTHAVESPMTIHTGPDQDSYLVISLCKPHSCASERAGILMVSEDFGGAGRQLGLAGICFYRGLSRSNNQYDFYADGIAVHAKTRVPIEPDGQHVDQCNAAQILATIHEFYPPE